MWQKRDVPTVHGLQPSLIHLCFPYSNKSHNHGNGLFTFFHGCCLVIFFSSLEVITDDPEYTDIMKMITQEVGSPKNYGLSPEEQEEQDWKKEQERRWKLAAEAAVRKRRNEAALAEMAAQYKDWVRSQRKCVHWTVGPAKCLIPEGGCYTLIVGWIILIISRRIYQRWRDKRASCWKFKFFLCGTTWWNMWCPHSRRPCWSAARSNRRTLLTFWYLHKPSQLILNRTHLTSVSWQVDFVWCSVSAGWISFTEGRIRITGMKVHVLMLIISFVMFMLQETRKTETLLQYSY